MKTNFVASPLPQKALDNQPPNGFVIIELPQGACNEPFAPVDGETFASYYEASEYRTIKLNDSEGNSHCIMPEAEANQLRMQAEQTFYKKNI
jgi:hypothetical protein